MTTGLSLSKLRELAEWAREHSVKCEHCRAVWGDEENGTWYWRTADRSWRHDCRESLKHDEELYRIVLEAYSRSVDGMRAYTHEYINLCARKLMIETSQKKRPFWTVHLHWSRWTVRWGWWPDYWVRGLLWHLCIGPVVLRRFIANPNSKEKKSDA